MDGYEVFCTLAFGTSFDPKKQRRRKNKLKNYKRNKRKRALQDDPDNVVVDDDDQLSLKNNSAETGKNGVETICHDTPGTSKKKEKVASLMKLTKIRVEEVTHFRRVNRIHVTGEDIPEPIENFAQLLTDFEVHPALHENIIKLGYASPTPIQMQAIPLLLHKRQILACAPTGSGKTAAFLIPIIRNLKLPKKSGFRALILSPTRELAKQIHNFCVKLSEGTNIRSVVIEDAKAAMENPESVTQHDILISTPNRLIYMLQHDPPLIQLNKVRWLIVDECDKLFEVGKQGFRDQLAVIYKACDSAHVKRAMFSATFSQDVEEWCKLTIDSVATVSIGTKNTAVETVKQELLFVGCEGGKLLAIRDLLRKGVMPPVMIFVQSKERAQELFAELVYDNIRIDVIHSDLSQEHRNNVVNNFTNGKIWVLVCTELMARGIDFKGVNLVINYDFPPTAISYIHRIGRTGRAGEAGQAITYFTTDDVNNLRSIAQVMKNAGCEVPEYILKLKTKKRKKSEPVRPIKREKISTVPKYQMEKNEKKKTLIRNSKKKKFFKKKKSKDAT